MKKKLLWAVMASGLFLASSASEAASFTLTGSLTGKNDYAVGWFTVDSALTGNLDGVVISFTDSFQAGNFDPSLGIWDSLGNLIKFDDDSGPGFDAFIKLDNLRDGKFFFTVSNWDNAPKSNNLWDGFKNDGLSGGLVPDSWGNQWSVTITGVAAAGVVPEPETWAMLLAGLGLVGAVARRQRGYR
ncbi:MAG: DVUA0089 family protein [Azoarcus sp.]|nr:DVUA0089 family protein [Azoarcus sp.]